MVWKAGTEEAQTTLANMRQQITSLEADIQFPEFRAELKRIQEDQHKYSRSPEKVTEKLSRLNELAAQARKVLERCQNLPITEKMSQFKDFRNIQREAIRIEKSIQKDLRSVQVDVSGLSFRQRLAVKAKRSLNVMQRIKGAFNAHTILLGASTAWDPVRLKTGKHEILHQAGAEHVQLRSKTGCIVDAHYLSAATFLDRLEALGGEKKLFEFKAKNTSLLEGQECMIPIRDEFPVFMRKISLSEDQLQRGKRGDLLIKPEIEKATGQSVLKDRTNQYYLVDASSVARLNEKGGLFGDVLFTPPTPIEGHKTPLSLNTEFPGIKFQKSSSKWQEAMELLANLRVNKSAWRCIETEDAMYLIPRHQVEKIDLALNPPNSLSKMEYSLEEKPGSKTAPSSERGVVLLTMPQLSIYEQSPEEMLTFALQGTDVMMYNNPGKGLSTGSPDRKNIDASIEAAYQFLKVEKNITDEKILAKGQCFGGAPTVWLGQEHPNINLMLDQNPANFHEMVTEAVTSYVQKLERTPPEKRNGIARFLIKVLKDNFIIIGLAKAVLSGYDTSADLLHNRGHKLLHINVPDEQGLGGDEVVRPSHPEKMMEAMSQPEKKELTLSMNPGGIHVTDWWANKDSEETVNRFLSRAGISQSVF